MTICPKCQYEQDDTQGECLRCGLVFAKYNAGRPRGNSVPAGNGAGSPTLEAQEKTGMVPFIRELLFYVPPEVSAVSFWARVVLLAALFAWSWTFILPPIESNAAGHSFMHLVNLPFHEAGHLVFRPFGRIVHSLGGTLGQILMPLICLGVLVVKTRDTFGGAVVLWWVGQNFIDIAPYINDARSLSLPLLGGNTGRTSPYGFHDWEFILKELRLAEYDHFLAGLSHALGTGIMLLAFAWGAFVLVQQYKNRA